MKFFIVLFALIFATVAYSFENQIEIENASWPKVSSVNSIKLDVLTQIPEQGHDSVNIYAHVEIEQEGDSVNGRSFVGLIYSSFMTINLGVGLWQHEPSPGANLGIGYKSEHHELDFQVDVCTHLKLRGFYNYKAADWLKLGLYGRSELGIGPRAIIRASESISLGLAYSYNPEKSHGLALAQLIIKF
ncbi:MAG: hypothetical protein WCO55_03940 [Candidatus Falkowbacteria bacterium]